MMSGARRATHWACLALTALTPVAPSQGDAREKWRLDLGKHCTAQFGATEASGTAEHVQWSELGVASLARDASRITFAPHAGFGVTSDESFTLELEFRTRRGRFATMLMCREGGAVHYSVIMGRETGRISLELWSWAKERALSRERLDDGQWHRLAAAYDAKTRSMALLVDGRIDAVVPVGHEFAGSKSPGLRLGDNLDSGVRQPFVGDVRKVRMLEGIPSAFARHLEVARALTVFEPGQVDVQLERWLVGARRARPPVAVDREDWERRAASIRAGVQDALGLWPPPYSGETRDARRPEVATDFRRFSPTLPLDVQKGGTLRRDTWIVTRTYWRTFDRYWASGWLYEPTSKSSTKRPAVLCPHGHWRHGARHPVVQSRCIQLAKLGYVVLAVDSVHHYEPRVGLTPVSLMTWNNLRGLELLKSLESVDAARIGCTGASGGGQQTYYLTALQTDLAAAAPAVMACHFDEILLSSGVHCACNFVTHLVPAADMPQMAAAFAPKPQLFLSVTGDWTRRFPERGFPEIARIYEMFDAVDRVAGRQWKSQHDYNRDMRNAMYAFFERHLRGIPNPRIDLEPETLSTESLATLRALDRKGVLRDLNSVTREFRARLSARNDGVPVAHVRARLASLFGEEAPKPVRVEKLRTLRLAARSAEAWKVRTPDGVDLPLLVLMPEDTQTYAQVALVVSERGKSDAFVREKERIDGYLEHGVPVVLADVRYLGELDRAARWRDYYGRFLGKDEGILAVGDLRCILEALPQIHGLRVPAILVGLGTAGATTAFAGALSSETHVSSIVMPDFGPSYRKVDRKPYISRLLLHGDLDDALRVFGSRRVRRRR